MMPFRRQMPLPATPMANAVAPTPGLGGKIGGAVAKPRVNTGKIKARRAKPRMKMP